VLGGEGSSGINVSVQMSFIFDISILKNIYKNENNLKKKIKKI
jgi:hypothetical protein